MEIGNNARSQLRALTARIEKLEDDKSLLGEDIKEVYAEAKGNGFDVKTLRKVIAKRKKSKNANEEEQAMLDLYWDIVGLEVMS
jgi:uncharacterized protein (UPF0335 family)